MGAWEQQISLCRPEGKLPGLSEGPRVRQIPTEAPGESELPAQPQEWEEETSGSPDTRDRVSDVPTQMLSPGLWSRLHKGTTTRVFLQNRPVPDAWYPNSLISRDIL